MGAEFLALPGARYRSGRRSPRACPSGMPGPSSATRRPDPVGRSRRGRTRMMLPPGGLKEMALAMQVAQHLDQPALDARRPRGRDRPATSSDEARAVGRAVASWTSARVRSMRARSTGSLLGARQLGIEREASEMSVISRSRRCDVVEDDRHQPALLLRVLDPRHGLDRAAQRGQRVLDLVGDVGGEALDRVHARPQRLGHLAQRAGEIADLVAAAG